MKHIHKSTVNEYGDNPGVVYSAIDVLEEKLNGLRENKPISKYCRKMQSPQTLNRSQVRVNA